MKAFAKLNPITKSAFFICAFVLTLAGANPVFSVISLCCALLSVSLDGAKAFFNSLKLTAFLTLTVGIFNMLFAHYGEDVLFIIDDIYFTLEALFYGLNQGLVFSAVVLWFRVMSYSINSSETAYLLRFAPKTALLFSMVLGFIPRFKTKLSDIRDAQNGLSYSEKRTLRDKIKTGVQNLSALVTYSLESSIITADSMNARGFGNKPVSNSRYRFTLRDALYLAFTVASFALILWAKITKRLLFIFEPKIYFKSNFVLGEVLFAAVLLIPFLLEMWEVTLWKRANSKA